MSTNRSFAIPTSTAMAGAEGWQSSGEGVASLLQPLKTGKPVIVRLLSDPADPPMRLDDDGAYVQTDWVFYREVGAWDGLLGGIKMKGGLMTFPVYDVIYYEDGTRTSAPRGSDLLFDAVLPGEREIKKGYNRAQASDMLAFNAVVVSGDFGGKKEEFNPKPGQLILVKLTGQKGRQLIEQLETKRSEAEDADVAFDPTTGAWMLSITGTAPTTSLSVSRKTKGIEPLTEDITPIDVMEHLEFIRAEAENHWEEQKNAHTVGEALGEDDEDELVDQFEQSVSSGVDYSAMAPARLKKLLTDAEVEIPARLTTAKLIELAKANHEAIEAAKK